MIMMVDSLDASCEPVNLKIDPVFIPSTAITKLERDPYIGGISDVWKCTISSELGTFNAALKTIRSHLLSDQELGKMTRMIRREVDVWITLKHDYILPFEGITDGFGKLPALVSRWMENGTLSDYLKREFSALSEDRKLELVRKVADGLGYLHEKDVVHGNLTDTNVLVDESGNVCVSDFGLATIVAEAGNVTFGSVQSGNTRWMAPEFVDYSDSDDSESPLKPTKEGDIYSFGCVMLQIFSGKEPYTQIRDVRKVTSAIIRGRDPFHGIKITMNNDYGELSSQCLSREPGGRPTIVKIISIIGSVSITNVSSTQPELDVGSLQDLTEFIFKTGDYPVAGGGFDDIWKCIYNTGGGQIIVAVKSLRTYTNISGEAMEKNIRRIRREIHAHVGIKHQNIIPLLGYTMNYGQLKAIVTPWAENGNLTTYLTHENACFSTTRRFEILRDITDGLQHLHACNVIHGGLTGSNVLIYSDGTACLSDFGLSLRCSDSVSISQADWTTKFRGSFPWLAPELLKQPDNGRLVRPSKSSDIYAFGGIMLQVLTGKIPYYYLSGFLVVSLIIIGKKPDRSRYPPFSDKYWNITGQCWSAAETRPSAKKIFQVIEDELKSLLGPVSIANVSSAQPELDVVSLQDLTEFISKTEEYPVTFGGFGDVWKCMYRTNEGQIIVAVKSPRIYVSDTSGKAMERKLRSIRREINICAGIEHRNIMPLLGYTMSFGPFMAMVTPWAENGSLTTYLMKYENARLSLTRRFEILRDIADGLQYLHTRNVIHGDLTGSNVLIQSDGTACLTDFGLSLRYSDSVSISQADRTTKFHASLPWVAPERLTPLDNGIPVRPNESGDIYAFGGVILQVLTSKIPYYYLPEMLIISSIIMGKKPDRSRYPSFSDEYWDIIGKCWSPVGTRPSAKEVLEVIGDELKSLSQF